MKNLTLPSLIFIAICSFAQNESSAPLYNVFKSFQCKDCPYKYFVSSNAGILNTPLGYKVGFLGGTGAYIGARFGSGKVYHPDTESNSHTNLFSITAGLIKPLYLKNEIGIYTYLGAGYGEWFNNRWDRWTKSGIEVETGLMVSYKRIMLSVGGSFLDGGRTYPKLDATVGLGVRF